MGKLLEHYKIFIGVIKEEQDVKKECQHNDIDFGVVKRIAESTPWTLRESFNFCFREKEANIVAKFARFRTRKEKESNTTDCY